MLTWLTCTRGNPTERKVKTSYNSKANNLTPKYEIVKKINFIKNTKGEKKFEATMVNLIDLLPKIWDRDNLTKKKCKLTHVNLINPH